MSVPNHDLMKFSPDLSKMTPPSSGHGAVGHWIGQRLSAMILVPLGVFVLGWVKMLEGASFQVILESIGNPWIASFLFLFITAASYHGVLGLQVIIDDYVHDSRGHTRLLLMTKIAMIVLPVLSLAFLGKIMLLG